MQRTIEVTADKPGRTVTVEAGKETAEYVGPGVSKPSGLVSLEVGGIPGQEEWTWLTPEEADSIAAALCLAAEEAETNRSSLNHA